MPARGPRDVPPDALPERRPGSMNLLCPNCQRMLSVPEQYAGQLMKCPLCNGTFTVPALPQPLAGAAVGPPETVAAVAPGPPPGGQATETLASSAPAAGPPAPPPDSYGVAPPAPLPVPPPASERITAKPAAEKPAAAPRPAPPPPPPPGDYARTFTMWMSPRVVPWIIPGALALVVLLLFAPW